MPTPAGYETMLNKLAETLKLKPMTARAIAKRFKCCKPVAYARVEALRARGEAVYLIPVREAKQGPMSVAYGVR